MYVLINEPSRLARSRYSSEARRLEEPKIQKEKEKRALSEPKQRVKSVKQKYRNLHKKRGRTHRDRRNEAEVDHLNHVRQDIPYPVLAGTRGNNVTRFHPFSDCTQ